MANYHAVYIDSPASWTYNTDSYDSKLGFYSNAWLTNETEETSETPVISCSYFYELGKQDEVGFTPRRISMSESSGILTVEGKQENVSSLVSKSFRLNSPSPRFLNLRESMRKRRPARFIVNNIITDDDAELNNIKDYLGLNEEEAEAISRSEEFGAESKNCPECDSSNLGYEEMPYCYNCGEANEEDWCSKCDSENVGEEEMDYCYNCGSFGHWYDFGAEEFRSYDYYTIERDTSDVDFDEAYMERQDAERIMKLLRIVKRKATGSNARYAKTYAREAENAYYQYGMRGLTTQVAYVLSNLSGWRGEEAKSVKAELRKLIK